MNYIERTRSNNEEIISIFQINGFMYWNAYFVGVFGVALFIVSALAQIKKKRQAINVPEFSEGTS